jgi:hypothetical protein
MRAGGRYVAASPALRVILLRAALFIFFASSIWALLPLTAQSQLHLGSGGYGLLLGCVGVGSSAPLSYRGCAAGSRLVPCWQPARSGSQACPDGSRPAGCRST